MCVYSYHFLKTATEVSKFFFLAFIKLQKEAGPGLLGSFVQGPLSFWAGFFLISQIRDQIQTFLSGNG